VNIYHFILRVKPDSSEFFIFQNMVLILYFLLLRGSFLL